MTNAAQFNATGERLTRATGPSPNAAYTVAFWVRIDTNRSVDYQVLFTFLMGASEWESIMLDASNRLTIEAGVGGSGNRVNAASAFGTGTWRYVALVRSSTTSLKAYVNGTETLSLTTNVSTRSAAVSEFAFGSDGYDEDSRSSIAYARAWTAALNTTELAAESASVSAVRTTDLWGDWPMQADGDDDTANARHLTASGTVSYVSGGPTWTQTISANAISAGATVAQPAVSQSGSSPQTVNANAIASAATVAQPAITQSGGGQTVNANVIASSASVAQPALSPGAVSVAPNVIASVASVAAPWIVYGVGNAGLIQVDATNPRYFSNGDGIVLLSGFHTWETLVDHGNSDPPDAFDYDAFLDALVADGCNFIKLWACESLRDWCDAVKYFYPYVYERTGPGNAADGKLKVDLTAFNVAYFIRLRERAIEAGNRGMFVCVQLFQGWQITQKGYSTGSPGTYHPFNAANNINSIDGDIDNDGQVGETRDITWTAVYDLQKAYVRAVIDAVNDLDHVIYEISNEEDEVDNASGQTKVAWQHALIDYIHTYESGLPKQHPVGMTVQWPSGSDTDLFSSNAEWISPKDAASVSSVAASSGDKVILWDTDHVIGLTDEHEWIWMAVTRGCNPLYMDEWDGDFYGTDKRLTAANVKIRDNLGYVQTWAAANVDLLNATPQSSLASTGYCLAKITGQVQVLAYQPTSGNFTVNLTSYAGTYTVEWLRPATGATSAGSNVSGAGVRTMTPPWAGEDAVVLLEKIADEIAANAIASGVSVYQVAVTVGAVSIAASAIASAATMHQPGVAVGAVTVAVNAIAGGATVAAPAVTVGSIDIGADAIAPVSVVYLPSVATGVMTIAANAIASESAVYAVAVSVGVVTVAPDAVSSGVTVHEPIVTSGGFVVQAEPIVSGVTVHAPALTVGAVTIIMAQMDSMAAVHQPAVLPGGVTVVADAISSGESVHLVDVAQSGAVVALDTIASTEALYDVAITTGEVVAYFNHVASTATVHEPVVYLGNAQVVTVMAIVSTAQIMTVAITAIAAGRIHRIAAESRRYTVASESRIYTIGD